MHTLSFYIPAKLAPNLETLTKTLEKMDRILTKERFVLFSQRCILRNTDDLLHFMLHRALSVPSGKIVCCHDGIPRASRDELLCGSFQLSIWRLTRRRIVFLILLFKISWY